MESKLTSISTCKSVSASPSSVPCVVVYRSAKYNGVLGTLGRICQYITTYGRFYLLQPIAPDCVDKFRNLLYELLGFLVIIAAAPILLINFIVLLIIRRVRLYFVARFHPTAIVCEDLSPRCILIGKSLGMVTSVVWLRGNVDTPSLRRYFDLQSMKMTTLRKILSDTFGVRVWMDLKVPFEVQNHVIAAPAKFYNEPITDEEGSQYGKKSVLQKFVTSCASQKLNVDIPPWQIFVIPQPALSKERTCCVLRFHYILLNDPSIQKVLNGIFSQELSQQSVFQCCNVEMNSLGGDSLIPLLNVEENVPKHVKIVSEFNNEVPTDVGNKLRQPVGEIVHVGKLLHHRFVSWMKSNLLFSQADMNAVFILRAKQYEFHTKTDFMRAIVLELATKFKSLGNFITNIPENVIWTDLKKAMLASFLICRSFSYISLEIIGCFLCTNNPRGNGFRRTGKTETRQISWSPPISKNLIEAIQKKTDTSLESIILTACSLALKDYYLETSLPNPQYIGVASPILADELLSTTGFQTLQLPTSNFNIPYQIQKINTQLSNYPQWKLIGTYYAVKNISYCLPRSLAYLILRKLLKRYPLTFTYVNIASPSPVLLPHISLWDHTVDEFTFWRAPQSDFCVSVTLVNYSEILRLSVSSPMKSVDTALTQKFCHHLNTIAEAVGVDRNQIPYSRKSSPVSTICSSPSAYILNGKLLKRS